MLRIFDECDCPVGVGFLVARDIALTCAHIVSAALDVKDGAQPAPGATVRVDLPLLGSRHGGKGITASIEHWIPAQDSGAGDVAVLRLDAPVPGAWPVRLVYQYKDLWGDSVRAFGVPAGHPGGVWHNGVLRAGRAEGWVEVDRAGGGHRIAPGFSGSPVWDDALAGVVGMVAVGESGHTPAGYLIPTHRLVEAWPGLGELILPPPSPFRSLEPYEESDKDIFHGRHADSERVAGAVGAQRTTTLVGPSGCGKSSLVRAGVIPRRRAAGDIPLLMRPTRGSSPLHALAAELLPLLDPEKSALENLQATDGLAKTLALDGLHDVVPLILNRWHRRRLLIVIDQFEELLDLPDDAVRAFAAALSGQRPPAGVAVLATLRADFVEPVQADERLRTLISPAFDSLPPMSAEQLREAISKPVAQTSGAHFEKDLVEHILADTGNAPRALPLLTFTLDQLWRTQHGAALTFQAYHALGGVRGALRDYADRAWTDIEDEDKPAARRLLAQLVRLPIGAEHAARRVVPRAELGDAQWRVAQRLAAARLITLNTARDTDPADALARAESIELAHEVLITAWRELAQLVTTEEPFLRWRETLRHDLARWHNTGRTPDRLPTRDALDEARAWLPARAEDLTGAERDFLQRGEGYRRSRTRRRRAVVGVLSALLLAAGGLGIVSVHAQQDAAHRAAVVRSGTLAADAQALSASDPGLAAQLAVAANRTSATPDALDALYGALQSPLLDNILTTGNDAFTRTATQADGPLGAAVDQGGTVHVWNLGTPATPIPQSTLHTAGATGLAIVPRAPLLAAECGTPGLCLWNLADPSHPAVEAHLPIPIPGPWHISSMAVSPDGTVLAAASESGYTLLWSITAPTNPRFLAELPNPSTNIGIQLASVAFAPGGSILAESIEGGQTRLWSLADPATPTSLATINSGYQDIAIDSAGTDLAGASDASLDLWNISQATAPTQVPFINTATASNVDLEALSFSPDARTLAFSGTDTETGNSVMCLLDMVALVQDPDTTEPVCLSTGFSTPTMAYTSSGDLLTGGLDNAVRLWRPSPALIANASAYSAATAPAVSDDGRLMIAALAQTDTPVAAMGIWNLDAPAGPALAATLPLSSPAALAAFLDPNVVLAVAQSGQVQLWNIASLSHPRQTASLGTVNRALPPADGVGSTADGTVAVRGGGGVLNLWHVTDAGTATLLGQVNDPAAGNGMGGNLVDNTVFMTTPTGIDWWNISDPAHPVESGFSPLSQASQGEGLNSSTTVFAAASPPDPDFGGTTLNLYSVENGQVRSTATVSRHSGVVLGISNDGHLLAASGQAGNGLSIWDTTDAHSPKLAASIITAFEITGVMFSADDDFMADWSLQTVQLWDTRNRAAPVLLGAFSPVTNVDYTTVHEDVAAAGFATDGKLLISVASDGPSVVYLVGTGPQQATDQLCSTVSSPITVGQWAQYAPGVPYQNPCAR
ncbi:MAG TPA: trypsin-like peptidase domain-containing protein [Actinocrinis sp.]|nr:trypsin-like peptidase domain-containing protein [Actinocrinis sp.]